MIQENSRLKHVNWRWIAISVVLVAALLLLTGAAMAYTGTWGAWFDRGSAAGEELFRPASGEESLPSAPGLNEGSPFNSGAPSDGGSGCEHENQNTLPPGLD